MDTTTEYGFELRGESSPLRRIILDIWHSRELLVMLSKKDFFVRYRRAVFGAAWAIALPLVQAVVLGVVLSRIARFDVGVNYATFVFAGILPWTFFSMTLTAASTAIVDGQSLATKTYFPRAILPLAAVGANVYAFLPSLIVLLLMLVAFGVGLGARTLLLLPATLLMIYLTVAFALVTSALHVYFRDVRYILQAGLLAWFWASAVFYPLRVVSGVLRRVVEINPATGMVELFRAATVGADARWVSTLWWSLGWGALLLALAAMLYRRFDRVFVDLL